MFSRSTEPTPSVTSSGVMCMAVPLTWTVTAALAGRKRMTGTQRRMLLVCTGCAAMVSVGIGFGITPYEDTLNLGGLLVHQRYYLGLAYLFLLLPVRLQKND